MVKDQQRRQWYSPVEFQQCWRIPNHVYNTRILILIMREITSVRRGQLIISVWNFSHAVFSRPSPERSTTWCQCLWRYPHKDGKTNLRKWTQWSNAVIFNPCATGSFKTCITWYWVRATDLYSLRLSDKNRTTANTTMAIQCECPVGNHKYLGHIIELHLIGHVT